MSKVVTPRWLDRTLFVNAGYYTLCTTEKQFKAVLRKFGVPRRHWPDFVASWHSDATAHMLENRGEVKVASVVCVRNFDTKMPA